MAEEAYPLSWPPHFPRRPPHKRERAAFHHQGDQLSIHRATRRLKEQLDRLRARDITLSSNVALRTDGFPISNRRNPVDPAVAVYFTLKGKPHCMPCDLWDRVADNIAAVAKHIDAMRGMERWGVGTIEAAFAGYVALPSPEMVVPLGEGAPKQWWEILGVSPEAGQVAITHAYHAKAKANAHDQAALTQLNLAVEAARKAQQ